GGGGEGAREDAPRLGADDSPGPPRHARGAGGDGGLSRLRRGALRHRRRIRLRRRLHRELVAGEGPDQAAPEAAGKKARANSSVAHAPRVAWLSCPRASASAGRLAAWGGRSAGRSPAGPDGARSGPPCRPALDE